MGQLKHYQAPLEGEILSEEEHEAYLWKRYRDELHAQEYARYMYEAYEACRAYRDYSSVNAEDDKCAVEAFFRFSGYALCAVLVVWAFIVVRGA